MKKLTVIGLSDDELAGLLPNLGKLKADFLVEYMPTHGEVHIREAEPEKPKALPKSKEPEHSGLTLTELILEWLKNAPGRTLPRDSLRDMAEGMGYSRNSVNPATTDLRKRDQVHADGDFVTLGPKPNVKKRIGNPRLPYGKPLPDVILEVLGDREVRRHELVRELGEGPLKVNEASADVCINKMMRANQLAYTGELNYIVAYRPEQWNDPAHPTMPATPEFKEADFGGQE